MVKQTVFQSLSYSKAQLLAERKINKYIKLARWQNAKDHVEYHINKAHTLSLYTQGGNGSQRVDRGYKRGQEGTLCILPSGGSSEWLIDDEFQFFHLYFSDSVIKRFYAKVFDKEPQLINIPDLTFHYDKVLAHKMMQLSLMIGTDDEENSLALQERVNEVFFYLLNNKQYCLSQKLGIKGGLSPKANRQVKEYIQAHYAKKISLEELADLVQLSEYHFQRMFTVSQGISPHQYLTEVRLEKAKMLMHDGASFSYIALQCGFSHQSHFNNVFRREIGLSPSEHMKISAG